MIESVWSTNNYKVQSQGRCGNGYNTPKSHNLSVYIATLKNVYCLFGLIRQMCSYNRWGSVVNVTNSVVLPTN